MKTISRQQFTEIVNECRDVLRISFGVQLDIAPLDVPDPLALQLAAQGGVLDFIGYEVEAPKAALPKNKSFFSKERLEQATVRCAEVFRRRGIDDFYFNEALNGLYADLTDVLDKQGYVCEGRRDPTPWDAVRRHCGIKIGPHPKGW